MGQTSSQFTEKELEDYQDLTYFSKKEVLIAHKKFKTLAPEKVGHNKNARLPMNKILQYPELRVNPFGDRICQVFSSSHDGDCTFEDFLDMMSVFSFAAPNSVKAEHAFRIFDFDGDDMLGVSDLEEIIHRLTLPHVLTDQEIHHLVLNVLSEADLDDDGALSFAEFEHVIDKSSDFASGSTYEGQWQNGKRHGLGVETRGRWLYRGEWTLGYKGRYGVRQSSTSNAKYGGTWSNGVQDGSGSETYADGGTYQGQWLRGMRHGYGVRTSAPFGLASHYRPNKSLRASLTSLRSNEGATGETNAAEARDRRVDDSRGGFVLKARSDPGAAPARRRSLVEKSSSNFRNMLSKMKKQRSLDGEVSGKAGTSGSLRSNASSASWVSNESYASGLSHHSTHTDSNASFVIEDEMMDKAVTETYMGEWKNDKRSGFGIAERSDGLKYEGEWFNNKKYGYGVTSFKDGTKEEGKYKNNVLITSQKKKHLFLIRSAKFRERIDDAVNSAQRASKFALQKADIAISRAATARGKGELADTAKDVALEDSDIAVATAQKFAPDFQQPIPARARQPFRQPAPPRQTSTDVPPSKVYPEPQKDNVVAQSQQFLQTPQPRNPPAQQAPYQESPIEEIVPTVTIPSPATDYGRSSRGPSVRRNSQQVSGDAPGLSFQQAMSDHFDHYKRPPSRDSSVDRLGKSATRMSLSSRQPSVDKSIPSMPPSMPSTGNGTVVGAAAPAASPPPPEVRRRTPAPEAGLVQPKRTESLFINPTPVPKAAAPRGAIPVASQPLQRKKSLPDVQALPKTTEPMSREEASQLSSARREYVRRVQEDSERLRANPLLYFVSPQFKDWFSRQQLILLVLFINISLAILFFKLLT